MKTIRSFVVLLALGVLLSSWGRDGHQVISSNAVFSFSPDAGQFLTWADYLVGHSSDADSRRSSDPSESPRHFIDIDNYPEFVASGKIPVSYSAVVQTYGEAFVVKQGILPWATLATYDSLKNCFERMDWAKAAFFAADLGHYVADGYMPLHITANYDGQLTGNKGIHSRYESGMVRKYKAQINCQVKPATLINDPESYIFGYLYQNYPLADSILAADSYAANLAGNTNSEKYTDLLWEKTAGITTRLFSGASFSFASLFYTAWVEAGSPKMPVQTQTKTSDQNPDILRVSYNGWFKSSINVSYSISSETKVNISVYGRSGILSEVITDGVQNPGEYSLKWKPNKQARGIWFIVFRSEEDYQVKKVVL